MMTTATTRKTGQGPPPQRSVVLVVEDEPILRMMAVDMVENAGFDVVEAADAVEAVEILERRLDIRIVFTDVDMPRGIDGIRLAAMVRDRWPPIEIIITSGKTDERDLRLPDRAAFFSKPYRPDQVVATMRKMAS